MDWTAKATGKSVRQRLVEVVTFKNALISKAEILPQDTKAILDTLQTP